MEKDSLFDLLNEMDQTTSISSENEDGKESTEPKEGVIPNERVAFSLFPFFIDLIDQFKDTLKNLRNFSRIFQDKFSDKEFGAYFNRMITEDIKKIELVEHSLLHYIRINNPIVKTDTVNTLIEEELKKYQFDLEAKKIKLLKTLEKNLPETAVPDNHLRYVLSCVLQYVMALMPPNGSFGLFTRSLTLPKEVGEDRAWIRKEGKFIEILMVYTDYQKPTDPFGAALGIPARQKERMLDLALRLVDEIVRRNRGMMKFEVDEKKVKTTISLRFPVERRKVISYQSAKELGPRIHQSKTTFEKLSSLEEMKKRD